MSVLKEWHQTKTAILAERERVCELAEEASDLIKKECGQTVPYFRLGFEVLGSGITISDCYRSLPHQKMGMSVYPKTIGAMSDHWEFRLSTAKSLLAYLETVNLGTFLSLWENAQE